MDSQNPKIGPESQGSINPKKGYLTLPFSRDQFREFISSLFGKPDKLAKRIPGNFEVELGDILGIYYAVEERLQQQNQAILASFTSVIRYDDNSSQTINSIERLSNYLESKQLIAVKIDLSWQYLVKFHDRNSLEKQEINLTIDTNLFGPYTYSMGGFQLEVIYTGRTWALDMESMLEKHVKNLIKDSSGSSAFGKFLNKNNDLIGWIGGFALFLMSIASSAFSTQRLLESREENMLRFISRDLSVDDKLNFIAESISDGRLSQHYFFAAVFLIVMLFVATVSGIFISKYSSNKGKDSFILLTRYAANKLAARRRSLKSHPVKFLCTVIVSLIVNLVSSYIFNYFSN